MLRLSACMKRSSLSKSFTQLLSTMVRHDQLMLADKPHRSAWCQAFQQKVDPLVATEGWARASYAQWAAVSTIGPNI